MFHRYDYEAEFYPDLSRLPLDLRRKLDVTGVKLGLKDWLALSFEERSVLCHLPCDNAEECQVFANYLDFLSHKYRNEPISRIAPSDPALWSELSVPHAVRERSDAVTVDRWRGWPSHDRYALYKTATSKSQPDAFELVLKQLSGN
ncbi:MAG: hypothetical protein EXR70_01665 [Deltaproteobacteria bacterium]|nr:hypothetical protein [Deltaproteobacteria bacterium]